jgi:hypothetical protein
MNLTFDIESLRASAEHSRNAAEHSELYLEASSKAPGLWLVGDHGVYLMSNGMGDDRPPVVYAKECNPDTDPDGWYEVKRSTFGGDDGALFISLENVDHWLRVCDNACGRTLVVKMTAKVVDFSVVA